MDYVGVKLVPCDYGSWEKRLLVLFGVVAWSFKASVMVSGLVVDWILDDVVWAVWSTDDSTGFLGGQIFFRGDCGNQPPNHLVEEGQPQVFTPFLKSREVVLCQETRDRPRSLGLVVPGDEADCVTLDALHLADILLLVWVPDDGTVL